MARFRAALELGCCLRSAEGDCSQTPLVSCVSANRKQRVQGRSHGTHRMPDAAATVHYTVGESNGTNGGVTQVAESRDGELGTRPMVGDGQCVLRGYRAVVRCQPWVYLPDHWR